MNPIKVSHPNPDQLVAFASGQVPEEVATEIGTHLAGCEACRTVVDTVPDDTLLSLLRKPAAAAGSQADSPPAASPDLHEAATSSGSSATAPLGVEIPPELAGHPRYHVQELLGSGGMGAVYKAEHRRMERQVALKVMNPELMNRPAMVERFHREVKAAAQLTHPHIVTAHDADQAGDTHFLVMEFVEGISLAEQVQRQGRLPVVQACDYVRQAARGLQHAFEQGMVHRDIKPHNLMLTPGGQVKILDFGLARFVRETVTAGTEVDASPTETTGQPAPRPAGALTEAGVLMGTADFIAPEQATNPGQADIRADIYSLGCTLYYLLAGNVPFPEGTPLDKLTAHLERMPAPLAKLRGDVPPSLERVIERMMAKDPAARYQIPAEVADALTLFISKKSSPRRYVGRWVAAALFLGAILLGGVLVYVQTDKGEFAIEIADDDIALQVNEKGIKIHDWVAKRHYQLRAGKHDIRSGEYVIDVTELPEGVEFSTKSFTLKRGGKTIVTATLKRPENKNYLTEEALSWFPADATFFGGRDMRVFPELSLQQVLVMTQLAGGIDSRERDRIRNFVTILGRIDRLAFAFAADPLVPGKSRIFLRATGAISHPRLLEWFRQDWPGATIREEKGPQGERITLVGSSQVVAPAFAVIGNTDLILAGYQGFAEKHLEVVQQVLELRAGRGAGLSGAHAKALQEVPDKAWMFMVGETPDVLKSLVLFRVLPRRVTIAFSGTKSIEGRLRGNFATAAEAESFAANLTQLKQQGTEFVKNPPVPIKPQNSELLAKTLGGLKVEGNQDRVNVSIQVSSEAVDALEETLRDLPLSLFKKMTGTLPTK